MLLWMRTWRIGNQCGIVFAIVTNRVSHFRRDLTNYVTILLACFLFGEMLPCGGLQGGSHSWMRQDYLSAVHSSACLENPVGLPSEP